MYMQIHKFVYLHTWIDAGPLNSTPCFFSINMSDNLPVRIPSSTLFLLADIFCIIPLYVNVCVSVCVSIC